ncbi:MAG: hypothetical protein DME76_03195 [Verrucomicrobia bacterium]|nr:MAG: hypothetical protein DME76_03195 [Verrucomicrobiota bacterium]
MKKLFVLSVLISSVMICSCQKQGSAAEQQLAQRKAELDAREKALDEREKAFAQREQAVAAAKTIPANVQPRALARDPGQLKAEREKRLQQLPPDLQGLIADPARANADREKRKQERLAQRQRRLEELQRARMSRALKSAATPSSEEKAASPTPSPTPQ